MENISHFEISLFIFIILSLVLIGRNIENNTFVAMDPNSSRLFNRSICNCFLGIKFGTKLL